MVLKSPQALRIDAVSQVELENTGWGLNSEHFYGSVLAGLHRIYVSVTPSLCAIIFCLLIWRPYESRCNICFVRHKCCGEWKHPCISSIVPLKLPVNRVRHTPPLLLLLLFLILLLLLLLSCLQGQTAELPLSYEPMAMELKGNCIIFSKGCHHNFFSEKLGLLAQPADPPPPPRKLGRQKKKKKFNVYFAF